MCLDFDLLYIQHECPGLVCASCHLLPKYLVLSFSYSVAELSSLINHSTDHLNPGTQSKRKHRCHFKH